jgi:hypothetical protein
MILKELCVEETRAADRDKFSTPLVDYGSCMISGILLPAIEKLVASAMERGILAESRFRASSGRFRIGRRGLRAFLYGPFDFDAMDERCNIVALLRGATDDKCTRNFCEVFVFARRTSLSG